MKTLEQGQDKIQKICNVLRQETLEPAKEEAERILEEARAQADQIRQEAKEEAEGIIATAQQKSEQEKNVFHSSLDQASRQSVETLRQTVENQFFNEELDAVLIKELTKPSTIADLINAVVSSIEKEGITANLSVAIPKAVDPKEVAALLLDRVTKRLAKGDLDLEPFSGGAKVKLIDEKMTLEITEDALKEVLARYVRKSFRELLFGKES